MSSSDKRPIPEPIDMDDGIPDRSSHRPAWKYLLVALIFLVWLAFLIYCLLMQ
jgi:uncharacterized membrane-anchored protein